MVEKGCANLIRHIENSRKFGIPVVVALKRFSKDTEAELNLVLDIAKKNGAFDAVLCEHFSKGGDGAVNLANAVIEASNNTKKDFKFLYDLNLSIEEKIRLIAKEIYRADDIELSAFAQERIDLFKKQVKSLFLWFSELILIFLQGFNDLPICMAKTQYSFSHKPELKGAPTNFILPIREVRASIGAGFIYPLVGAVLFFFFF